MHQTSDWKDVSEKNHVFRLGSLAHSFCWKGEECEDQETTQGKQNMNEGTYSMTHFMLFFQIRARHVHHFLIHL